ncbi:MAG: Crp/Fnr family transcriptional regulator [Burkholderiaceae bacterium]|nr:Crp/Fnr family transcriptional regulator [Burkholderiaceae bacterium]
MPADDPPALDAAAALAQVPWLAAGSAEARALLLRQASVRRYERQQAVFHRGDPLDHLWIVIEGRLEMSVVGADGRRFVAAQVPPGEAVGFIPLVDRRGAIHDARAVVPTAMLRLPREAFLAALQADVELLQAVLRLLLERGRRLNEWRAEVTMRPLLARLARLLLGLAQAFGADEPDGAVSLAISQDDLAAMVGVTRQALNPEIKALERSGVVELAYRRVILRDVAGLRTLAREGGA